MSLTEDLEITHYVEAVRSALADLPPRQRDELLEDLPGHLAEVRSESDEPLERRLGPPEVYAAELRAAMGLTSGTGVPLRARLDAAVHAVRGRVPAIDRRAGVLLGYERGSDFLRMLTPAWWVLRGYLAAMVFVFLIGSRNTGLIPRVNGSEVLALVLLAAFVLGSIWLGRHETGLTRPRRTVLRLGTVVLALWSLFLLSDIDGRATIDEMYDTYSTGYTPPGQEIQDIYVYDKDGRLITDVRLFDQNGQPIELGWDRCAGPESLPDMGIYPFCPDQAPFQVPPFPSPSGEAPSPSGEVPSPSGEVPSPSGEVPSPSESPAPSMTQTLAPSPSAS